MIELVSGSIQGGAPVYTSSTTGGTPNNYYEVAINPYTGMPIVDRP